MNNNSENFVDFFFFIERLHVTNVYLHIYAQSLHTHKHTHTHTPHTRTHAHTHYMMMPGF